MEAIAIPMPLWWRLLGRLYAFALRLIPQEKQKTKADDRAGQMAADALDTYGNAILRCAYSYLHNMADAEEVLQSERHLKFSERTLFLFFRQDVCPLSDSIFHSFASQIIL